MEYNKFKFLNLSDWIQIWTFLFLTNIINYNPFYYLLIVSIFSPLVTFSSKDKFLTFLLSSHCGTKFILAYCCYHKGNKINYALIIVPLFYSLFIYYLFNKSAVKFYQDHVIPSSYQTREETIYTKKYIILFIIYYLLVIIPYIKRPYLLLVRDKIHNY